MLLHSEELGRFEKARMWLVDTELDFIDKLDDVLDHAG
jgi:hypothetical protein